MYGKFDKVLDFYISLTDLKARFGCRSLQSTQFPRWPMIKSIQYFTLRLRIWGLGINRDALVCSQYMLRFSKKIVELLCDSAIVTAWSECNKCSHSEIEFLVDPSAEFIHFQLVLLRKTWLLRIFSLICFIFFNLQYTIGGITFWIILALVTIFAGNYFSRVSMANHLIIPSQESMFEINGWCLSIVLNYQNLQ